jgi:hypothetical protein
MVGSPAGQQLARLVAVSRAAQHQPGSDGVPTGTRVQAHGFEAVVQLVKVLALDRDAEVELFLVLSTPVCTVGQRQELSRYPDGSPGISDASRGPSSAVGRATLAHQIVEGADSGIGS